MILAAGRGARLKPITDTLPKPLIEVAECSLIESHLYRLAQSGFKRVIINLHHLGSLIKEKIGDGSRYDLHINYSIEAPKALETAGGIIQALPLIHSDQFIVISSDIICDYPLEQIGESLNKKSLARIILCPNPAHHLNGDFYLHSNGLVDFKNYRKPKNNLTYSGIACFDRAIFENYDNSKLALRPVLENAIQKHHLTGQCYTGLWMDIGTPKRLELARQSTQIHEYIESIKPSAN